MEFHIRPMKESYERFLNREGALIPSSKRINWDKLPKGRLPVVLVGSGKSATASIAYSELGLVEIFHSARAIPKKIFLVASKKLLPVTAGSFRIG